MVTLQVSRYATLLVAFIAAILLVGCSSGEGGDPNYNKDIVMTEEQRAKEKSDLENRPPPGTVDPKVGVPRAEPGQAMKPPPGKGGK